MFSSSSFLRSCAYRGVLWRRGQLGQLKYTQEFEKTQFFCAEKLADLQLNRLRNLIQHAYLVLPILPKPI